MMTRPGMRDFPLPLVDVISPGGSGIAWDCVAQASWESFPASDAPAWVGRRLDTPPAGPPRANPHRRSP
jgi:hypothetical protein